MNYQSGSTSEQVDEFSTEKKMNSQKKNVTVDIPTKKSFFILNEKPLN